MRIPVVNSLSTLMASHPVPGDNHLSTGGRAEKHRAKQKWPRETYSVIYVPGLSTLSDLSRIDARPPPSFFCCPRPTSHHPSTPTSFSLGSALHLLRPSTPFWPYGINPLFPHAQTISIISDLLYSQTPFLFQLSYAPLHSSLYPFMTPQPIFSSTSSQEYSLSFSQHFSYPMHASLPYNTVGTITHSYRHSGP